MMACNNNNMLLPTSFNFMGLCMLLLLHAIISPVLWHGCLHVSTLFGTFVPTSFNILNEFTLVSLVLLC